jgi:hypothetical protein
VARASGDAKVVVKAIRIGTDQVLGPMHADLSKVIGDSWPDVRQILECVQLARADATTA